MQLMDRHLGRTISTAARRPAVYADEVDEALAVLDDLPRRYRIDTDMLRGIWDAATEHAHTEPPVWVHGDIAPSNLLVRDGRLSAVIDFGSCGVGDPACDYAIAWTFFDDSSRAVFRAALESDDDTWQRARGWALWKALIVRAGLVFVGDKEQLVAAMRVLETILDEET